MNILIDIGHPAHVHALKNFAHQMVEKGNKVLFTCREKEFITQLIEREGFEYVSLGSKYTSTLKKIFGLFEFDYKLWKVASRFKAEMFLSLGSMYAAQVAWFMRKPHICLEDTYNKEQVRLYLPFTKLVLTGYYDHPALSLKKEFRMAGYNELAYLHPHCFTPDESVLSELGVQKGEPYTVIRFVAWQASHDVGFKGLTLEKKLEAVREFSRFGKVFISSESALPEELAEYRLPTHPSRVHDVEAFASLVFGESSTMCEEAAMLGVPSVYLNSANIYYTQHLEKDYDLMYNFGVEEEAVNKAIAKGVELLSAENVKDLWKAKRDKMLSEKIDVTAFLVWIVENYPNCLKKLKEQPDFQFNFR